MTGAVVDEHLPTGDGNGLRKKLVTPALAQYVRPHTRLSVYESVYVATSVITTRSTTRTTTTASTQPHGPRPKKRCLDDSRAHLATLRTSFR